jgi:hypothetical protein
MHADRGASWFCGAEAFKILGSHFKKNSNKKNEYKLRYETEYLFRCKSGVLKPQLHKQAKSNPITGLDRP